MFKQRKPDVVERLAQLNPEPGMGSPEDAPIGRPLWAVCALAAAALVAAFVIATVLGSDGAGPGEERAFAREAIRIAEGNPRLLVGAEGWSVDFAGEFEVDQGNIDFANGEETLSVNWTDPRYYDPVGSPKQGFGEWSPPSDRIGCSAPLEEGESPKDFEIVGETVSEDGERTLLKDVHCEMRYRVRMVDFLGSRVPVAEDETTIDGEQPSYGFYLQLPPSRGVFVSINASGMSPERFEEVLGTVYSADVDTWLAALPPEVVQPLDRPEVVDELLRGIPLHPEVDVEALKEEGGALDRYQLGAEVSGTVACAWLDQWARGVRTGDRDAIEEATEAMSGSREWPVLKDMADEGGFSQVIWEYSRDMERDDRKALLGTAGTETIDGKTYELGPSYATGLGCDSERRVLREEG